MRKRQETQKVRFALVSASQDVSTLNLNEGLKTNFEIDFVANDLKNPESTENGQIDRQKFHIDFQKKILVSPYWGAAINYPESQKQNPVTKYLRSDPNNSQIVFTLEKFPKRQNCNKRIVPISHYEEKLSIKEKAKNLICLLLDQYGFLPSFTMIKETMLSSVSTVEELHELENSMEAIRNMIKNRKTKMLLEKTMIDDMDADLELYNKHNNTDQINKRRLSISEMRQKINFQGKEESFLKSHLFDLETNEIAFLLYASFIIEHAEEVGIRELFVDSTKSIVPFKECHLININGILGNNDSCGVALIHVITNQKTTGFYKKLISKVLSILNYPKVPVHLDFDKTQLMAFANLNIKPCYFHFSQAICGWLKRKLYIEKANGNKGRYSYTLLQLARCFPWISSKHQKEFVNIMREQANTSLDREFLNYIIQTFVEGSFAKLFPLNIDDRNTNNISEGIFSVYSRRFGKIPTAFELFRFLSLNTKTQLFQNKSQAKESKFCKQYQTFLKKIAQNYQTQKEFRHHINRTFCIGELLDADLIDTEDEIELDIFDQIDMKRICVSDKEFKSFGGAVIKRDPLGNKRKTKGPQARIKKITK